MKREIWIGDRLVGDGHRTYVVAEIGINHNGSLDLARQLIDCAVEAGCDAVKFQKRTPDLCVPTQQRDVPRETPWGRITYLEYRHRLEFGEAEFAAIDAHCRKKGISWFASCWDVPSVDFIERFRPPCYKIASATLTQRDLLERIRATGKPALLSTGMSTMGEITDAVAVLDGANLLVMHSTGSYPCELSELNLRAIETLRTTFPFPVGYSGHEVGLPTTIAAVALGACLIERHITLDRSMWGSDQSASVEPSGFVRLVKYVRAVEAAMGDGVKRVYASERPALERLRRFRPES